MKYIDAEKLKTKIKGIQCEQGFEDGMEERGYQFAIKDILDFITSLQQEQPCDTCTNDKGCVTCKDGELWEGKEQPSEDLENAAKEIATDILGKDYLSELDEDCAIDALNEATNLVKAGAEWHKQQMLKDAVGGYIAQRINGELYAKCHIPKAMNFEFGDKVKIIIIGRDNDAD